MKSRKKTKELLFTVVAVLLFFGIIEGVLQVVNQIEIRKGFETSNRHLENWERGCPVIFFVQDAHLGWRLKPGGEDGYGAKINSLGFRDREIDAKKAPGTFRVLCCGDSSAFGDGVEMKHHYTRLADRLLNKKGDRRYEVINAGVGGYTSYQVRVLVEEVLIPLEPDAVTILVGVNDFCSAVYLPDRFAYKSETAFNLNIILTRSEIYRRLKKLLFPFYREIYHKYYMEPGESVSIGGGSFLRVSPEDLVQNIRYVADLGLEHGFKVFVFQYMPNYYNMDHPHESTEFLPQAAQHENTTLIDLPTPFTEVVESGRNPFQADGGHPNELGNEIIAHALVEALIGPDAAGEQQTDESGEHAPEKP